MKSPLLFATALLLAGLAHADEPAPNADKRALNLAVQRDGQHNQSAVAAVSLPVGDSAWLQAGVGRSRSRDAASGNSYQPTQLALGGGVAGRRWQASVNASQRRDGSALRQSDVAAALDWKPTGNLGVGLDAARRSGRNRPRERSSTSAAARAARWRARRWNSASAAMASACTARSR